MMQIQQPQMHQMQMQQMHQMQQQGVQYMVCFVPASQMDGCGGAAGGWGYGMGGMQGVAMQGMGMQAMGPNAGWGAPAGQGQQGMYMRQSQQAASEKGESKSWADPSA